MRSRSERGFYVPSFYEPQYARRWRAARATSRSRAVDAPVPVRKAALKTTDALDPPATEHLHARHRVRLALPRRGRARLREPVPLLLGRLQLPAGARVSRPTASSSSRARRATHASRVGLVSIALCDHPEIERILGGLLEMGYAISPASLRLDDLTEPIVRMLRAERRAEHHHRAGNRLRSPAPRHQQDGDERRDPRSRRPDFRERDREPEAVLHDRPPDRDRRGPGGDPRSDAADARAHAEARAAAAGRSAGSSAA